MIVLDIFVVITGLPKMCQGLGFLAFGGLLLFSARAGGILGRRLIFTAVLALSSVATPTAQLEASLRRMPIKRAFAGWKRNLLGIASLLWPDLAR